MPKSRFDFNTDHVEVAAAQTDSALGTALSGSLLERVIATVSGAGSAVSIKDGAGAAIPLLPASTPVGVHVVEVGARSNTGAWSVTTGANVTVVAVGDFTKQG